MQSPPLTHTSHAKSPNPIAKSTTKYKSSVRVVTGSTVDDWRNGDGVLMCCAGAAVLLAAASVLLHGCTARLSQWVDEFFCSQVRWWWRRWLRVSCSMTVEAGGKIDRRWRRRERRRERFKEGWECCVRVETWKIWCDRQPTGAACVS